MKELNEFMCDPQVRKSNINTILYVAAIVLGLVVLAAIPKQPGNESVNSLSVWSENRNATAAADENPRRLADPYWQQAYPELRAADVQASDNAANPELRSVERARARQFVAGAASGLYVNPELKVLNYAVPAVEADLYRNPELKVMYYAVPAVEADLHRNPELKALDQAVVIRQARESEVRIPRSRR